MTGKPTPGPWRYDENGYLRGSDNSFVGGFHEGRNDQRQRAVPKKADRALILAAPEMADLLREISNWLVCLPIAGPEGLAEAAPDFQEQIDALLDRLTTKGDTDDDT